MSSNKAVKERLIQRYGAKCFIERLRIRDTSGMTYTGKRQRQRMKMLTYHHIKEKSKGGKATIENGALLSAENHQWFHQQDRADRQKMNQQFQDLKRAIDHGDGERLTEEELAIMITKTEPCRIELAPEEEIPTEEMTVMTIEIPKKGRPKPKKIAKKKKRRRTIKRDYRER